jgi:hypothetical protein
MVRLLPVHQQQLKEEEVVNLRGRMLLFSLMLLFFSFMVFFLFSSISFAQNITITGQGSELSVQIDDGTCIEFKMEVKEYQVTLADGKTVTHSRVEYKYWRPCGEKKWTKYEKYDISLLRKPSSTPIISVPKKKYL